MEDKAQTFTIDVHQQGIHLAGLSLDELCLWIEGERNFYHQIQKIASGLASVGSEKFNASSGVNPYSTAPDNLLKIARLRTC